MGLFSSIGGYLNKRAERDNEEYDRASRADLYSICKMLKGKNPMTIGAGGIIRALRERASETDDYQLKDVFIHIQKQYNQTACMVLAQELEQRGYLEKDSNGKYCQTDKWQNI